MNREKRFREIFRFCKDIPSQSSKIACPRSRRLHGHDYAKIFAKTKNFAKPFCLFIWGLGGVFWFKKLSKISSDCPFKGAVADPNLNNSNPYPEITKFVSNLRKHFLPEYKHIDILINGSMLAPLLKNSCTVEATQSLKASCPSLSEAWSVRREGCPPPGLPYHAETLD